MDNPNAFVGKKTAPTIEDISAALGPALAPWNQLISWLQENHGVSVQEWNSFSVKYGWSLRLKLKKRTIVHLSPCSGCVRVAIILGERAVQAAEKLNPLKGTGFSPYINRLISAWALAPEGLLFAGFTGNFEFSAISVAALRESSPSKGNAQAPQRDPARGQAYVFSSKR